MCVCVARRFKAELNHGTELWEALNSTGLMGMGVHHTGRRAWLCTPSPGTEKAGDARNLGSG